MLVGNGYVPGHADYAVSLLRGHRGVRALFERRLAPGARPAAKLVP
jgi:L-erythro-3,5-diaminohexanoate dehydrogenase